MATIEISPFEEAIDRLLGKTAVASRLRSADWEKVPAAIADRAQLSAGVDSIRVMDAIQSKLQEWVTLGRDNPERAFMDRSKFVAEMRGEIGAPEGDTGELTDIASRRRLELIYDFQTQDAMEAGRFKIGQDPDVLDAFPAQELIRVEDRMKPRDWIARWQEAGGQLFDGRMIALKSDPIWRKISRFDKPWPPFDFGSGMGVEDVSHEEAIAVGLIDEGFVPEPADIQDFNAGARADVSNLDPDLVAELQRGFGGRLVIEDGEARFRDAA